MKWLIRRCDKCSLYTLRDKCPQCGSDTVSPHPAKFSPSDKYARYKAYEGKHDDGHVRGRREDPAE